jgi:hypothetical protein
MLQRLLPDHPGTADDGAEDAPLPPYGHGFFIGINTGSRGKPRNLNVKMRKCYPRASIVLWCVSEISPAAVVANFTGGLRRIGDLGNQVSGT